MKRAWLAALVLMVPLAGFECTVEVTNPDWTPNGSCDYWLQAGDAYCADSNTLYTCELDNRVHSWDCSASCLAGETGTCGHDARQGITACICSGWSWEEGYMCNYENDRTLSECSGDRLIYCGNDNYISGVDCDPYCFDYYGDPAVTGTCGYSDDMGANNCLCVFPTPTCSHAPYCADSLWLTQCNAGGTADEYVNCDDYCVGEGYSKGVCDVDACLCG